MPQSPFPSLLEKYLAGECSPAEQQQVEAWFKSGGDTSRTDMTLTGQDQRRLLNNLHRKMDGADKKVRRIWPLQRIAAAVIFLTVMAGAGIWASRIWQKKSALEWVVVTTPKGKVQKLVLPDHSEVWLNANSVLRYAKNFRQNRRVTLQGEALFTVTHDAAVPFTVTANDIVTQDLGTTFNINGYSSTGKTNITVVSGSVGVSSGNSQMQVLKPQQAIIYDHQQRTLTRLDSVKTSGLTDWVNGKWVYENMQVQDLVALLQHQYDVTIHTGQLNAAALRAGINVNFSKEQSALEIIEIFCALTDLQYKQISNREINIYSSK
ncbi:FecR family protein [Chitinophaga qingshengii]|uniref:FecR family protein n=1 Tax=Chitinophaga qingshengii TaxID=1569794 RepID=A0ABR7TWJ0_9BACT|nr:FecR family protein [Chitinophaga qingshengii]MBC9934850.1 FecR family protein [Chitinophaga qingshengii]